MQRNQLYFAFIFLRNTQMPPYTPGLMWHYCIPQLDGIMRQTGLFLSARASLFFIGGAWLEKAKKKKEEEALTSEIPFRPFRWAIICENWALAIMSPTACHKDPLFLSSLLSNFPSLSIPRTPFWELLPFSPTVITAYSKPIHDGGGGSEDLPTSFIKFIGWFWKGVGAEECNLPDREGSDSAAQLTFSSGANAYLAVIC